MKHKINFDITPGRLFLLGLTFLMVMSLYGLALLTPSRAQSVPQSFLQKQTSFRALRDKARRTPPVEACVAKTVQELQSVFQKYDFTLSACRLSGCVQVPRLELLSLPVDLQSLSSPQKKDLFLRTHLPLILRTNEAILKERRRLQKIIRCVEEGRSLSSQNESWLLEMMKKYRLKKWDLQELLVRIDVLPPSLALGQSAIESGWGTSFAARKKNSTFGMTVRNKVLGYASLQACVDAYIRNINANPAYKPLREIRARLREEGVDICAVKLAEGLVKYSELGQLYIQKVQDIIQSNNLRRFDTAQLMPSSLTVASL